MDSGYLHGLQLPTHALDSGKAPGPEGVALPAAFLQVVTRSRHSPFLKGHCFCCLEIIVFLLDTEGGRVNRQDKLSDKNYLAPLKIAQEKWMQPRPHPMKPQPGRLCPRPVGAEIWGRPQWGLHVLSTWRSRSRSRGSDHSTTRVTQAAFPGGFQNTVTKTCGVTTTHYAKPRKC